MKSQHKTVLDHSINLKKYLVELADGGRKEDQSELEGGRSQLTQTLTYPLGKSF